MIGIKGLPGSTDGLGHAHQRGRQLALVAGGARVAARVAARRRQRPRHVAHQRRDLELALDDAARRHDGARAGHGAALAVAAVLLGERLVVVVRVVLFYGALHLRLRVQRHTSQIRRETLEDA